MQEGASVGEMPLVYHRVRVGTLSMPVVMFPIAGASPLALMTGGTVSVPQCSLISFPAFCLFRKSLCVVRADICPHVQHLRALIVHLAPWMACTLFQLMF